MREERGQCCTIRHKTNLVSITNHFFVKMGITLELISAYDTNSHTRMESVGGPKVTDAVRHAIDKWADRFLTREVKPDEDEPPPEHLTHPTPQPIRPKAEKRFQVILFDTP